MRARKINILKKVGELQKELNIRNMGKVLFEFKLLLNRKNL